MPKDPIFQAEAQYDLRKAADAYSRLLPAVQALLGAHDAGTNMHPAIEALRALLVELGASK